MSVSASWFEGYGLCRNITLNESKGIERIFEPISYNITNITCSESHCYDIRIGNAGCNISSTEIPRDVRYTDNATWAYVIFLANASVNVNTNYSVYYKNASANAPDYSSPKFTMFVNNTYFNMTNKYAKIFNNNSDFGIRNYTFDFDGIGNWWQPLVFDSDGAAGRAQPTCQVVYASLNDWWGCMNGDNPAYIAIINYTNVFNGWVLKEVKGNINDTMNSAFNYTFRIFDNQKWIWLNATHNVYNNSIYIYGQRWFYDFVMGPDVDAFDSYYVRSYLNDTTTVKGYSTTAAWTFQKECAKWDTWCYQGWNKTNTTYMAMTHHTNMNVTGKEGYAWEPTASGIEWGDDFTSLYYKPKGETFAEFYWGAYSGVNGESSVNLIKGYDRFPLNITTSSEMNMSSSGGSTPPAPGPSSSYNGNITITASDEDTMERLSKFKLLITNNSYTKTLTIGKYGTINIVDDLTSTGVTDGDGAAFNYSYGQGYNYANYSLIYTWANALGDTANIYVDVLNPNLGTFATLFSNTSLAGSPTPTLITANFNLNNTNGTFGDYPTFRLRLVTTGSADITVSEVNLTSPYTYRKIGTVYIGNFSDIGISPTTENRFIFSNTSYYQRSYFMTLNQNISYTLNAYLGSGYTQIQKSFITLLAGQTYITQVSDVLISIYKSGTLVAQEYSNSIGTATIPVDIGYPYRLVAYKSGYAQVVADPMTFFNDGTTISIAMSSGSGASAVNTTSFANYYWYVYPVGGTFNTTMLIPFRFTYNDSNLMTSTWGVNITYNGTSIYNQSNSGNYGNINLLINTSGRVGQIIVNAFANRTVMNITQIYYYSVVGYNYTHGLNETRSLIDASGLGHPVTDILGFFIVMISMAMVSRLPWHMTGVSIFGLVVLGIVMWLGLIQISVNPYINWSSYMGLCVLMVSILYLRSGM